ncbi:MAG: hypothetical protein GWN31_13535 [Candidatus Thorarchaeota archaeon]|nr:hypothetical protein [Candidatus Thorarchaeota archaeon]NIW14916.1 hypothetical protein [Candidatus Thorarchaeota archaeon]NIW52950.1 hypothetical protein [Candidatus Korarchaeota archaeon]
MHRRKHIGLLVLLASLCTSLMTPLKPNITVEQTKSSTNAQLQPLMAPIQDANIATTPRTIPEKPKNDREHPLHRTSIESHPWINVNETQPLSLQERAPPPTPKPQMVSIQFQQRRRRPSGWM